MVESMFRGMINFLFDLGIYDVLLPFLLVFTIVFAILEKTRVFGHVEIDGVKYTKKNLNAMTAFVSAFLVVASSKLVAVINESLANIVLLLLILVSFLLLIGTFYAEDEKVILQGGWRTVFMIAVLIGILLIFSNSLGWLDVTWEYVQDHWQSDWMAAIFFIIMIVVFIAWVTYDTKKPAAKEDKT